MARSSSRRRGAFLGFSVGVLAVILAAGQMSDGYAAFQRRGPDDDPRLRLRATPRVGLAPASILFVGTLDGGPDDNEELYCTTIEWDWGDDTLSESTPDCEPLEPGRTEIRRRFSVRHTFDYAGRYEVRLNLKRRDDILISARTRIEVRGNRFR
ncbi:MAG: PKD domain-containing protein [Acidobacteria bacterium]|nr:PKD domain-containing protein [Acidobacteriota bacterium]